ncbi:ABC transporter substrate-binding protein [Vallitalea pronyensis]|uniref:ABC transporter substrate-binding protein n=1 Tax=Vallitalea pronyensis TaxID=1348613 RepID=A0A8J8MQ44_9FIRM|nr:ABC transporter substrate-binding protein [Vallitalea pronyensis]QUI25343.1 ABC transporter substrate-binding protein [Vallitalea pronyensis]
MKGIKKVSALIMTIMMMISLVACGEKSDSVYKIGVVQLVQHDALDAATEGFQAALTEKLGEQVEFDIQNGQGDSATCSTIVNSFVSNNVDLIMANATPALQAAASGTLDIPILGTSITDYGTALEMEMKDGLTGRNISGTSDLAPLDEQAIMIMKWFPKAENIGILYCSAEANSAFQVKMVKEELESLGRTVKEYTFVDSNDVAAVATKAAEESDVIYIPTDNTAASNASIIDNICRPAGVPIIAGEAGICAGCGVATLSISYYDIGYETGLMAYEILANDADISKMEIKYSPKITKLYNAAICKELGLTIPEGYEALEQ